MKKIFICVTLLLFIYIEAFTQNTAPLVLSNTIELAAVRGRIDHLAVDVANKKLFIAELENGSVDILDLHTNKIIKRITGLASPQGLAFVPATNTLYIACRDDGRVLLLDTTTYTVRKEIKFEDEADNIHYLEKANVVIVAYGDGGVAVIDAHSETITNRTDLGGHPEGLQGNSDASKIFVNVPAKSRIFVINKGNTVSEWNVHGVFSNFAMALDEENHLLAYGNFVPAQVTLLDSYTGVELANVKAAGDIDDLFFADDYLLGISGTGLVQVWQITTQKKLIELTHVQSASGARTGLFVPALRTLFIAAPSRSGHPARLLVYSYTHN